MSQCGWVVCIGEGCFGDALVSVSVCRVVTIETNLGRNNKGRGWGWGSRRTETDSTIEKGVMGVGEGKCVCVSAKHGGGGGTTHKPSWTLSEELVRS